MDTLCAENNEQAEKGLGYDLGDIERRGPSLAYKGIVRRRLGQ